MDEKVTKYHITGMSCAACQARIEKAVSNVLGVKSCAVSLLTNTMRVEGHADTNIIVKTVEDAGYGASVISDEENENILIDKETPKIFKRLILSIVFLLILMYFSMGHMLFKFPLPRFLEENMFYNGIAQMVLAFIVMCINRKFFISGIKGAINLSPNMDTLVSLGSGVSFIWSIYNLFNGSNELYFESSAMILTLITVGKLLEAKSKGRTTDALKSLVKLMPKNATVMRDNVETLIPIDEIERGEIFIVHSGETIPVDGIILDGKTSVNESALTGESRLVEKKVGDHVSSGTINQIGLITCKATRVGVDTTLSQIIKLVSDAASTKAPIAKIADKVSGIFVPSVICIAIITFILWILQKETVDFALARAISVLVISCPCALGLATPVAIMVGSGVGAKHGILFKTAVSLEETGKTQVIALDKTGTVTKGIPVELIVNKVEGATIDDDVREDSKSAVTELKNMGIEVVMLTGDKEDIALKIGDKAGIENVIYGLSPSGKADVVDSLRKEAKTMMVGDGINDAVALTKADIGIAIGAGTDVAIDAADVVLMNSKLTDVSASIRLSRQVLRIIHQNLFWAFFYNVIGIPLAAGCFIHFFGIKLTPMFGAAAMSLSSFFVVSNSLRLNLYDIHRNDNRKCKLFDKNKLLKIIYIYNVAKEEEMMTKTLKVEGMMCEHCEAHVKKALEKVDGVKTATASHKDGTAIVTLTKDVEDKILKNVVEDEGYKVKSIK